MDDLVRAAMGLPSTQRAHRIRMLYGLLHLCPRRRPTITVGLGVFSVVDDPTTYWPVFNWLVFCPHPASSRCQMGRFSIPNHRNRENKLTHASTNVGTSETLYPSPRPVRTFLPLPTHLERWAGTCSKNRIFRPGRRGRHRAILSFLRCRNRRGSVRVLTMSRSWQRMFAPTNSCRDDEQNWPAFTAGAHIDVEMKTGLVRQYSLCNSPQESNRYCIAVRHDPAGRGGSDYLHTHIKRGDILNLGIPRNNFPLNESFSEYLLIAGGIGVTPLLSMAYHLHATNRPFELHQCARNETSLAFRDEQSDFDFADSITTWLDDATFERRFDAKRVLGIYRPGCAIYLCGPAGFMRHVTDAAKQAGWPGEAIFSETFVPPRADATENTPFEVEIASSGQVLNVAPDEFLIDVLHANGVAVMCSCTQGICGSCMTPVLSGEPEHRDVVMTEAERAVNNQMTVCVSRAKSARLVLDL